MITSSDLLGRRRAGLAPAARSFVPGSSLPTVTAPSLASDVAGLLVARLRGADDAAFGIKRLRRSAAPGWDRPRPNLHARAALADHAGDQVPRPAARCAAGSPCCFSSSAAAPPASPSAPSARRPRSSTIEIWSGFSPSTAEATRWRIARTWLVSRSPETFRTWRRAAVRGRARTACAGLDLAARDQHAFHSMTTRDPERIDHELVRSEVRVSQRQMTHIGGQERDVRRLIDERAVVNLFAAKDRPNPGLPVHRVLQLSKPMMIDSQTFPYSLSSTSRLARGL